MLAQLNRMKRKLWTTKFRFRYGMFNVIKHRFFGRNLFVCILYEQKICTTRCKILTQVICPWFFSQKLGKYWVYNVYTHALIAFLEQGWYFIAAMRHWRQFPPLPPSHAIWISPDIVEHFPHWGALLVQRKAASPFFIFLFILFFRMKRQLCRNMKLLDNKLCCLCNICLRQMLQSRAEPNS